MHHPLIVTLLVILAGAGTLILYDCWLYAQGGASATISWQAYLAAKSEPIITLALGMVIGILFGHLFWPNCGNLK